MDVGGLLAMDFIARVVLFPVFLVSYALKLTGLRGYVALGYGLGDLLRALHFRRAIVLGNLELAFGGALSPAEKDALERGIYRNVGMVFLGILRNFSLSREEARAEVH